MPTPFPTLDPESGTLVPVDYYSVGEVAEMFHMSQATVRRRIKAGEFTVFQPVPGAYYMTAEHVAEVVAARTGKVAPPPPDVPEGGPPPRLGIPVHDADLEGIR